MDRIKNILKGVVYLVLPIQIIGSYIVKSITSKDEFWINVKWSIINFGDKSTIFLSALCLFMWIEGNLKLKVFVSFIAFSFAIETYEEVAGYPVKGFRYGELALYLIMFSALVILIMYIKEKWIQRQAQL